MENTPKVIQRKAVIRKPRSHTAYALNLDTKEIIEIPQTPEDLERSSKHKFYFVIAPRTIYCSALNKVNAKNNFAKQINVLMKKQIESDKKKVE